MKDNHKTAQFGVIEFFRTTSTVILMLLLFTFPSLTSQAIWTGGLNHDWHEPQNWQDGSVPTPLDTVLVSNYDTIVVTESRTAQAKELRLSISSHLTVASYAQLVLKNSTSDGIVSSGTIICEGDIHITNTFSKGISNLTDGVINVTGSGLINIDTSGTNAISSTGIIDNHGVIEIDSAGCGVNSNGVFSNYGMLTISRTSGDSFENHDSLYTGVSSVITLKQASSNNSVGLNNRFDAKVKNLGRIEVEKIGNHGVANHGTIENYDSILVHHSRGVFNNGPLFNYGDISIYRSSQTGLFNTDSLYNSQGASIMVIGSEGVGINNFADQTLLNDGYITIDSTLNDGIINHGLFINKDTLSIRNTSVFGIQNYNTLQNSTTGFLHMTFGNVGVKNASSDDTFINSGKVILDNFRSGFQNSGLFINEDSLIIQNIELTGIYNFDSIRNVSKAVIIVHNVTSNDSEGIELVNGHFVNEGDITISAVRGTGLSLTIGAINIFTNRPRASLKIDGAHSIGLNVRRTGTLINENDASVQIINSVGLPLCIEREGQVIGFSTIEVR